MVRGAPDLVIEVLSENTTDRDRFVKRDRYAEHNVPEYWIVDPDGRTVEVMKAKGERYKLVALFEERDRLSSPALPDLDLDLTTIWV